MSWSIRCGRWTELDPALLSAIRAFARTWGGKRDKPLDDAWWSRAIEITPPTSPHGFSGHHASPLTTAFECVLEDSLGMSRWRARNEGADQLIVFPPFMFSVDTEPPFWSRVSGGEHRALLGDPVVLLDNYKGVFDDDEGRAYDARGKAAFARLHTSDDVDELFFGVEYAMENLLREAWNLEVPVFVYW